MSDLLTSEDLKTERATEPPKRWRNWWRYRVSGNYFCWTCGDTHRQAAGSSRASCRCYPSKDVAETRGEIFAGPNATYLGAFPDGEAP